MSCSKPTASFKKKKLVSQNRRKDLHAKDAVYRSEQSCSPGLIAEGEDEDVLEAAPSGLGVRVIVQTHLHQVNRKYHCVLQQYVETITAARRASGRNPVDLPSHGWPTQEKGYRGTEGISGKTQAS